jgi:hypothetical protein
VNCKTDPVAIEVLAGVTAIDTSVGVTVKPVEPLTEPETASIVVLPTATPLARPAPLMVATAVLEELQVTELVRFCVLPSLYVPVAVNCCVPPAATDGLAGVTAIDTSVGAVTVRPVEPLMEPDVAWMVVLPVDALVARPALLIDAIAELVELQVTELVRFCVLPLLYVPMAVYCSVRPLAIEAFAGVTASEVSVPTPCS